MEGAYRKLTQRQRRFLTEYGINPEEFLSVSTSAEGYTFYHIKKRKEVSLRR